MRIDLFSPDEEVTITTPHDDPDLFVNPKYEGTASAIARLKGELNRAYGYYGHGISADYTTNLDLAVAAHQTFWRVVSIDPDVRARALPPGAVS